MIKKSYGIGLWFAGFTCGSLLSINLKDYPFLVFIFLIVLVAFITWLLFEYKWSCDIAKGIDEIKEEIHNRYN